MDVFGRFRNFGAAGVDNSSADALICSPPIKGLGGILAVRMPPRGGCGKEFMLIVLRKVLPDEFMPGERIFGNDELLRFGDDGSDRLCGCEGARKPLLGRLGAVEASKLESVGIFPVLLRVFGNAGSADVGGPIEGLAGRGMDAIVVARICFFFIYCNSSDNPSRFTKGLNVTQPCNSHV